MNNKLLVWDWPVRLGHWLMAGGFALAWLTAESERWALVHAVAGGTVLAVALFRLAWGFLGTRYARFGDFVRGPRATLAYLRSLFSPRPDHHTGHNPAGGWAIVALLALACLTALTGWLNFADVGGHWLEELHEGLASTLLAVVVVHVLGVLASSLRHGENLVRAMFTGRKAGGDGADAAIASARPWAAVLLLAWAGVASWWIVA